MRNLKTELEETLEVILSSFPPDVVVCCASPAVGQRQRALGGGGQAARGAARSLSRGSRKHLLIQNQTTWVCPLGQCQNFQGLDITYSPDSSRFAAVFRSCHCSR